MRWYCVGFLLTLSLCVVAPPFLGDSAAKAQQAEGEIHMLAVGVCPPYRKHIPVDVCRHSVKHMTKNVLGNLNIKEDNIKVLLDADSTGNNFLQTLSDYKETLTKNDQLIVYLLLHGDAFHVWSEYYRPTGIVAEVSQTFVPPNEDILVFWTREEPSVPALALAQKDWLTAADVAEALDAVDAEVALILDSCSSGLFFQKLAEKALKVDNIDFVLTSSGPQQVSNFDPAVQISLFARELGNAISLPYVRNLGQAVEHARMTTVLHATAQCTDLLVTPEVFKVMFPALPVPTVRTSDGKVTPALWSCVQVPNVVDLTGKVSGLTIE